MVALDGKHPQPDSAAHCSAKPETIAAATKSLRLLGSAGNGRRTRMLTRETIGDFKVALSEALRTTDQEDPTLRERFVELRPGTIGTLQTDANQLLSGGEEWVKSTTLAVLQQEAEKSGRRVISVEIESHKLRAHPDVLIGSCWMFAGRYDRVGASGSDLA